MNKKILKTVYKLRYGKETISTANIIKIIRSRYNIEETNEGLKRAIIKLFPKRGGCHSYSPYQINLLIRFYKNFYNKEKALQYFNNKFKTNLTYGNYLCLMNERGIKAKRAYMQRSVSKETEQKIILEYKNGESTIDLARKYGYKTPKSINDILKSNNIKCRDYSKMQSESVSYASLSFEKIDTYVKGYFLGLMLTDGFVSKKYLAVQLVDEDCIAFLSKELKAPYFCIPSRAKNLKPMYRLVIHGKKRLEEISYWGVIQRKSLTLVGPPLDEIQISILPMVLRGIIDGDGWIRKDGKEFFICSASERFIDWCDNALVKLGFSGMNKKYTSNGFHGLYTLRSAKKENIKLLKNLIYKEPFGMMRKYNRVHAV